MQFFNTLNMALKLSTCTLFYFRSQKWSRERLEGYQNHMLCRLIKHAGKNVPYYRDLFKMIKFDPEKFRGIEDLKKIPILDKEILRTRQKDFIADNAERYGIKWDTTSGTTGTPLKMIIDYSTRANYYGALLRSYNWAGYFFGKKSFSAKGYFLNSGEIHFKRLFNNYRLDSNRLNEKVGLEAIYVLNKVKPKFYHGYPFTLLKLGQFALKNGITIHSPDSIIVYGETLSEKRKELLERIYDCKVFDFYSLHECSAMISDCKKNKKHFIEDFAYHEVVDDEDNVLDNGLEGTLIGTNYYNYAMPLIRYRIGDKVSLGASKSECECGTPFKIVDRVIGRQNDYIETADGRLIGNVLEHSIDNANGVIMSQIVQERKNHICINVITDDSFNDESVAHIIKSVRKRVGDEMEIDIKAVKELEKTPGGKTQFLLSKVGNKFI